MPQFDPAAELPSKLTSKAENKLKSWLNVLNNTDYNPASVEMFEKLLIEAVFAAIVWSPLKTAEDAWGVVRFRVNTIDDDAQNRFMDAFNNVKQLMTA